MGSSRGRIPGEVHELLVLAHEGRCGGVHLGVAICHHVLPIDVSVAGLDLNQPVDGEDSVIPTSLVGVARLPDP